MSSIDKLLIRGIRSFDPQTQNVIEFYTPLTIIVGPNGAGKTTIIECLKYATTGELPPNSKGGAFVFDPKLAHETEVKAQIRLKFKNINNRAMIVTRSLQLTQKKAKTEMKTLESILVTKDPITGEQASLSSKCAEMDAEIPLHLGVSKAILEDVIFCHQEESNWPLAEPSVLKKKFDDIFAATKYTKALDELKNIKKNYANEIKLEIQHFEFLKIDTEKAKRLRNNIDYTKEKIKASNEKIASLESDMETLTVSMNELTSKVEEITELRNAIDRKNHEIKTLENSRNELRSSMASVLSEEDNALEHMIEEHHRLLSLEENSINDLEKKKTELLAELNELTKSHTNKSTEKGLIIAELKAHELRFEDRKKKVSELANLLNIRIHDDEMDEENISLIEHELSKKLQSLQTQRDVFKNELRDKEQKLYQSIQEWLTLQESSEQLKKIKRKALETNQSKISTIRAHLSNISFSQEDLDSIQLQSTLEETSLTACKELLKSFQYESKLSILEHDKEVVERDIHDQSELLTKLNRLSEMRTKLSLKKVERSKRETAILNIYDPSKNEIKAVLNVVPAVEDLEKEIETIFTRKTFELKNAEDESQQSHDAYARLNSKIELTRSMLDKSEKELHSKEEVIERLVEGNDFRVYYEKVETEYNEKNIFLSSFTTGKSFYEDFLNRFKDEKECPLCHRGFGTHKEEMGFEETLMSMITNLPRKLNDTKRELQGLEGKLNKLKLSRNIADDIERLKNIQIPELKLQLELYQTERERIMADLDHKNGTVAELKAMLKDIGNIKNKSSEMSRLIKENKTLVLEISYIENELSFSSNGSGESSSFSLEEVTLHMQRLQSKLTGIRADIDKLNNDYKNTTRECQLRELKVRDSKEKINEVQHALNEKNRLEDEKSKLFNECNVLEKEIREIDSQLLKLAPELDRLSDEKKALVEFYDSKEIELASDIKLYTSYKSSWDYLQSEIHKHQYADLNASLIQMKATICELEAQIQTKQKALSIINEDIGSVGQRCSQIKILERNIKDNRKYREMTMKLSQLKKEAKSLICQASQTEVKNYTEELGCLKEKQNQWISKRAGLLGEIKQLEDQTYRYRKELDADYKDIDENYQSQFIKVKTSEFVISDVEKYAKALDNAIMKYHSLKMEEINKIIRELWVNTYQGSDIDTIEIRSDTETAKGNRSYNYRVVMLKGDTELDMRGRSSAGQRVLTSLIIRLALAETFGLHCGILALDEPTTNLDRANIESLAESLANIIKARRAQSNFQLIVITHDEEFVQLLGKSEFCDYYWRVSRDDHQHSIIERQAITSNPT